MNSNPSFGGARPVHHLSTTEMIEAAEVFTEANHHVLANLVGEARPRIMEFIASTVLTEKPYLLVTPEGLDRAIGLVYENKHVTDYVLTLLFTFGSRWGMSTEKFEGLAANLAAGASPIMRSLDRSAVPNALASRLASFEEAYSLLVANQWLVILLLLHAFVKVTPQDSQHKTR